MFLRFFSVNSQNDDFEKVILSLKRDNENFLKENVLLKRETMSLNERISVLDKDMTSFKDKYEELLNKVIKFNKRIIIILFVDMCSSFNIIF